MTSRRSPDTGSPFREVPGVFHAGAAAVLENCSPGSDWRLFSFHSGEGSAVILSFPRDPDHLIVLSSWPVEEANRAMLEETAIDAFRTGEGRNP